MTNLHPGGYRGPVFYSGMVDNRLFLHEHIKRTLQRAKPDPSRRAHTSIATGNRHGGPHQHNREMARRERQAANRK